MTKNSADQGHVLKIAVTIILAIVLMAGIASAEVIQVGIFIKDDTISLDNSANILIYILSTDSFDAPAQVNISSVRFEGVEMQGNAENKINVNSDGFIDLGLHFKSRGSTITCGNNRLVYLKGKTKNGADIVGWSTIIIKDCIYTSPPVVNITSADPPSPVNDTIGTKRTFYITVNQSVNVTWYINGANGSLIPLFSESDVTESKYTNYSASVGTWNITAVAQNGSISSGNTDIRVWEWNVDKVSTSISVTSSPNPSTVGQSVTFTATVSGVAPGAGTPTGTVSFNNSGVTIGTGTLNSSGQATFSTSNLSNGSHTITAVYNGDTNFSTSEISLTQVVNQASTTTVVYSNENPSTYGDLVTFTANVTSSAGSIPDGETVTFKDGSTTLGTGTTSSGNTTFSIPTLSAGSHSITAVYAGDANFSTSEGSLTQTVNKADPIISVTSYSVAYDGNAHTATVVATGAKGEDLSADVDLSNTTHTNAGDYLSDFWTFTDSTGNHNSASGTVHDSISRIDATITVNGYTGIYDGNSHSASGTATGVGGTDLSASLNLGSEFTNVPGGTAHWTFTGGTNYNDASGDVNIVISKADATITVTPYSVTYDGNAHTATGTATGVKGESLTGLDLSGTTHTNAGDYPSDPWTFIDTTGNYNDESGTVHDAISKADQTINFDPLSDKIYGSAPFTVSATSSSGLVVSFTASDDCTVSGDTVTITGAGSCTITASQAGNDDYNAAPDVQWTFSIAKRPVTVMADSQTKIYGDADPSLTYKITSGSLAFSDAFTGGLTRDIGENVGTYAITQGTLALNGNYDLTYVGAYLTITPKVITVTADAKSKTYGDADPALTYTNDTLAFSDTFSEALSREPGEANGTYPITQGTLTLSSNYILNYVGADLVITQAALIIKADDKSKTYGASLPAFTVTYTGLVNGDIATATPATASTTATASSGVGSYPITASGAVDDNYTISYTPGTLTVTKADITITLTSSVNHSVFGQPVTFIATVNAVAPGAGLPTGTVLFDDNGVTIGTGTLNASGQANFSISSLSAGSHFITANYTGDTNFTASSGTLFGGQTVNQASSLTAVTSSINPSVSGQSVTFSATVSAVTPGAGIPNGTVQFKLNGSNLGSPVVLSNGSATSIDNSSLSVGTHTITAEYGGDGNFNSSNSSALTQTVNTASTTLPTTTTTPSPAGASTGSSGCGGGVITKENLLNIKQYESREAYVHISDGATVFRFTTLGIVNEIGFTAKTNEGCITARGELLKERPSQATSDAPGTGIVYFNVWVGSLGYSESPKVENQYIVFSTHDKENSRSVKLMMYKDSSWIDLRTEKINADTYKAYASGFGNFAIVEIPETPSETITQPTMTPQAVTNEPVPQKPVNWNLILILLVVIASVTAIYSRYRERLSRKK